jgi:hypothetical protein
MLYLETTDIMKKAFTLNEYYKTSGNKTMKAKYRYSNRIKTILCLLALIFLAIPVKLNAEELRKLVQLSGYWKFSVGDYTEWANPQFDDSKWDEIRVPGKWEDSGYEEYNGYAWYRTSFKMVETDGNGMIYLLLGRIDDVNEVYLNGKLLGRSGSFPPKYRTAFNEKRKYSIPREFLNFNQTNTLAIRVYDSFLEGGIMDSPVGIYMDEDYTFLDMDLSGKWKFHLGDNKQWSKADFDDAFWSEMRVPSEWEQEGYADYDGYAWYRKEFRLSSKLRNSDDLYLALGKIDDYDHVYLNGVSIGNVFDLPKDGEYKRRGYEYNARRIYKIPKNLLKTEGVNVIAVRVYDEIWRGGIYEGPIGIMTESKCREYRKRHYVNQTFWDYVLDEINVE